MTLLPQNSAIQQTNCPLKQSLFLQQSRHHLDFLYFYLLARLFLSIRRQTASDGRIELSDNVAIVAGHGRLELDGGNNSYFFSFVIRYHAIVPSSAFRPDSAQNPPQNPAYA